MYIKNNIVPIIIVLMFFGCATPETTTPPQVVPVTLENPVSLSLEYVFGSYSSSPSNVYAIWVENSSRNFLRPVAICERLLGKGSGALANPDALPFWHLGKYPSMASTDVDAVTGPTLKKQSFNKDFTIAKGDPCKFTVYFETDVSFNANDWFSDQPGILYSVEIDLNSTATSWPLQFIGWTSHAAILTTSRAATGNTSLAPGELVLEKGYIENLKATDGSFGGPDSRAQTNLVGSLQVMKKF